MTPSNQTPVLYSQEQIVKALRDRYRLYNTVTDEPIIAGGLTARQHENIGDLLCALNEPISQPLLDHIQFPIK